MKPATKEITNSDDIIDSRDVIERIRYLQGTKDEGERAELTALEALQDEADGYAPDWKYGCALIRNSYFEDYARSMAEDIGAIKKDMVWPCNHIDWEAAAEELKQDYTSVDFDGVEYWVQ